jgi:hypothetical protein
MKYKITLLDTSLDTSEAIISYVQPDTSQNLIKFAVTSENIKLKNSIESILNTETFTLSPKGSRNGMFFDGVFKLEPYTIEFLQCIPEIFGWRGYKAVIIFEKSVMDDLLIYKSEDITTNAQGDQIIKRVPKGMIAVNKTSGKVVMGGKLLNAKVEDGDWSLVYNLRQRKMKKKMPTISLAVKNTILDLTQTQKTIQTVRHFNQKKVLKACLKIQFHYLHTLMDNH